MAKKRNLRYRPCSTRRNAWGIDLEKNVWYIPAIHKNITPENRLLKYKY